MLDQLEVKYGLPTQVMYCKRCVMSNQRPTSTPEFRQTLDQRHKTMRFNEEGICDACLYAEQKAKIDWKKREKELVKLCDQYRSKNGSYDCLVPGSGGKDSVYASHILKYKYGMHPLTVTWPPMLYTDIGYKNFRNWLLKGGFDNISFNYNPKVHALLTRLAIENLLHPFQTFIFGQKYLAPKIALKYKIPLVFYGENEAEYGNPIADNETSLRSKAHFTSQHLSEIKLAGLPLQELMDKYNLSRNDLSIYMPLMQSDLGDVKIQVHYLGYYLKWTPQEAYYYSVEHTGFEVNPFRSEGTYSKYVSLDDKLDGFHFYTTYIKFGFGRTSYDASQEIRNKHLTREEGIALVKKFDGEFPKLYFKEVMDYIGITQEHFMELCDKFRSPHLWKKENGQWKLRHPVE